MSSDVVDSVGTPTPAPVRPDLDVEAHRVAGRRRRAATGLLLAALVAAAAWLPFLHSPLGSDESGFLLLARSWGHGRSLYGDYWVDRPPLLLWLFSGPAHLGPVRTTAVGVTAPAVKLLGAAASGVSVVLTGILTGLVSPGLRRSRRLPVVLAVALLSSPLLGMPETDGEVLAVPFVLLGLACLVAAMGRPWGRRSLVLTAAAGASGMAAALVKQNVVDVFVFATVLAVLSRHRVARLAEGVTGFAGGATAVLTAALAGAWVQGTSPAGLWDAIVVFRLRASGVIGSSASDATSHRMAELAGAFVASGAAVVLVVSAGVVLASTLRGRRRPLDAGDEEQTAPTSTDLTWPVLALVAWESSGVALGGSYWLHYLTGLVPGLVMLVAVARPGVWGKRALLLAVGYATAASLVVWVHQISTATAVSSDARVMSYLREHARSSDGVVVAFGHPDIVAGSGLQSPYENLWSLPVRVRDPRLQRLQAVMAGPSAPRWVVVAGDSLASWGLDPAGAQQYLERHYVEQVTYGDWHVWHLQGRQPR